MWVAKQNVHESVSSSITFMNISTSMQVNGLKLKWYYVVFIKFIDYLWHIFLKPL